MALQLALALASTGISVIGSMQSASAAKAQEAALQRRQFATTKDRRSVSSITTT